jgi:hypothetical protein
MNSFSYSYAVSAYAVVIVTPTITVDTPSVITNGTVSYYLGGLLIGTAAQNATFAYDFSSAGAYTLTCVYNGINTVAVTNTRTLNITIPVFIPQIVLPPVAIQIVNATFNIVPVSINLAGQSTSTVVWTLFDSANALINTTTINSVTAANQAGYTRTFSAFGIYKLVATITTSTGTSSSFVNIQVSPFWTVRKLDADWRIYNFSFTALNYQVYDATGTLVLQEIIGPQSYVSLNIKAGSYKIVLQGQQINIHNYPTLYKDMQTLALSVVCTSNKPCGCLGIANSCDSATAFYLYNDLFNKIRYDSQIVSAVFTDFSTLFSTQKEAITLTTLLSQLTSSN